MAGLALAAAVTILASTLSSQHIGLSSEPLSAGEDLAPPAAVAPPRARRRPTTTTRRTSPLSAPSPTPTSTVEEQGEASHGDD